MPSITEVYAADLGSNPYGSDERSGTNLKGYVATFNTPSDSFNTIVMPKVYGGNVGDVIKVSVLKGSIPDDALTEDDNGDTDGYLDINDFVEESTYTVTETIPSTGINVQFDFSTIFTRTLLGDTYTVVVEQLDSSGVYVPFSPVFCTDRDGVGNFVSPEDQGYVSGSPFSNPGYVVSSGGAGNTYLINAAQINTFIALGIPVTKYTFELIMQTWTVDGFSHRDPCPAWGIYNRINGIYTALGTTRSVSRTIKNEATRSVVRPVNG